MQGRTSKDENNWKAWEKILTDRNFREMFQQYLVPMATVQFMARQTAPDGWLICNGAAISRTVYADLFAAIGTAFGNGDGSTTFNIPDLRGEFIRGWDMGRGIDLGRLFGSYQKFAMQNIHFNFSADDRSYSTSGLTKENIIGLGGAEGGDGNYSLFTYDAEQNGIQTATETRPRSIALLPVIKY